MAVSESPFVHLHVHSEYSLLDGLSSVEELAERAQQLGMPAIALTDHGALYGAIDFYGACKERGVKPIIGLEAYVAPRGMTQRDAQQDRSYSHLVLLAKDLGGYRNLLRLVSEAHLEGYFYKPRIDRELLSAHHEGLVALSGCLSGEPSRALIDGDPKRARASAGWYRELFGEDYFLELQEHGLPDDTAVNRGLAEISAELGIPLVATNDSHYTLAEQAPAQDLLLCAQMNTTVDDPKRLRMDPAVFYMRTPSEMQVLFAERPDAIRNTLAVAERCDLKLTFDRLNFPELSHIVPPGVTPMEHLVKLCWENLPRRYPQASDAHRERLSYELGVVETTGFASYILFVWDFVAWARAEGIACGPRGSAAGSIILYLLGVADVDPIEYGLTFERFLNPERIQMPDIDMDFADISRERVIEYVVQRYGRDHVAQIATFGRLQARAAIRDTGRALAYPLSLADRVAKLIPTIPIGLTIEAALGENPELKKLYDSDLTVRRLIDASRSIEGAVRTVSTHAAGVVVAGEPLVQHVPLQRVGKNDSAVMAQYSMKPLEKIGLLKMDFLGLANLTMLQRAVRAIEQTRGIKLDLGALPPDDPLTFEKLSNGETHSVFQLEGGGMTRYIKELKPTTIRHLLAMVALYRPGPMAHIPAYIKRKEGKEPITYPHESLHDLLEESYGVIVFQDQVLQIVQRVAGYSLGRADNLRRAMGKKLPEEMRKEQQSFLDGAKENGYPDDVANQLWEYIEPFAGYAFNKAHSACYALIAYQTAYLKAHFPAEWMAAVLTTDAGNSDRVVSALGECRRLGISLLRPDINRSQKEFSVEQVPSGALELRLGIRYGLSAIKNVGEAAVDGLIGEREQHGPFASLDDFCRRVDSKALNKRVIESLIKCGALDDFGARERVLAAVDQCIATAQQLQRAADVGQTSMFAVIDESAGTGSGPSTPLPVVPALSQRERLAWEKETLGLFFSDHPFQEASRWLAPRLTHNTSQITEELTNEAVTIAGAVSQLRRIITRKNRETMAIATIEDLHGSLEVTVFPSIYARTENVWEDDAIVIVRGRIEKRNDALQLLCESAERFEVPEGTPPELIGLESAADAPPAQPQAVSPVPRRAAASHARPNGNGNGGNHRNGAENGTLGGLRNGHRNGDSAPLSTAPAAMEEPLPRRIRLIVRRSDNPEQDISLIEQLHALLPSDGHDEYEVLLDENGRAIRLRDPLWRTALTPALQRKIEQLLGPASVEVQELAD